MKSRLLTASIFVLLLLCFAGMVHSVLALSAEFLYKHSRYGGGKALGPKRIAELCQTAHRLHPWNYYFCIWAGKQAFYGRHDVSDVDAAELSILARKWADEAFRLNRRNSEAVHLQAEVRDLESHEEAIALWEDYRDWHFWEPFNHWMLFDLYMRAGRIEDAEDTFYWLQKTEYAARADALLRGAWARRRAMP